MEIIKAKDIEQDDEWMQEDVWDEIYNAESEDKECRKMNTIPTV